MIATEKKLPPLTDVQSIQKIQQITPNIGITYSGLGPDFRFVLFLDVLSYSSVLVRKGRKKAQSYFRFYKTPIPVVILVKELANIMQEFTQSGGVRPFGISVLVVGFDEDGPHLYQVDPSGSFFPWKATAIGRGMIAAKSFLEKRYLA